MSTAHINRAVIGPIRASKNSTLLAVASRSKEKGEAYAREWGIPHYHSSYEALLADPDIDVVYNSLPNSLHAEWSIKAMQNGKHVLCEKPIATRTEDVDAIARTAEQTGMVITEAFMYRHHPQTLLVKQMVDGGELGNIRLIRGSFCYFNRRADDTRFDPALGGGCLWDIGCYPVGYARYLVGNEPLVVYGQQVTGATGVDVLFAGQLLFPGEVMCQFECSFITVYKVQMEIMGDKGRIIIPEPYKPGKRDEITFQHDGKSKTLKIKGADLYLGEIQDMENAILLGTAPRISLADSRGNIVTLEALLESARLSKPITIQPN